MPSTTVDRPVVSARRTRPTRRRTTAAQDDEAGSADRFLKLLVAQMQNQDPLNPMDNAQVTSQMAQINTVTGIEKLNDTVQRPERAVRADAGAAGRRAGRPRRHRRRATSWPCADGVGVGGFELAGAGRPREGRDPRRRRAASSTRSTSARQGAGRHELRLGRQPGRPTAQRLHASASAPRSARRPWPTTALMRDRVDAGQHRRATGLHARARRAAAPSTYADVKAFN
ncbi:MAG: hypothetical protein MZW92_72005 [Comamonadaceae bacterium]|nr:hypothetical protein [Comamonadaceae bacterium]